MGILHPNVIALAASVFVCCACLLCGRLWADRIADQQHARVLFGRIFVGAVLITFCPIPLLLRHHATVQFPEFPDVFTSLSLASKGCGAVVVYTQ